MGAFFIASMSMFTSCKDYDDDLNNHESQIKALQAQIQALENAGYVKAQDLTAAKAELENKITSLTTLVNTLQTQMDTKANKTDLDGNATQDWVKAQNYALQTELAAAVSRLAAVEATASQIATIQAAIETLRAQLDTKADKAALDKVISDISTIDATLVTLAGQIDGVNGKIDGVNGKIDGINGEIANLKKADETLEGAIATANNNIDKQLKLIEQLQKALSGKSDNSELNKLAQTVEDLQKQIDAITPGSGADFQSLIDGLTGRVSALEGMKATLDAMKDKIDGAPSIGEVKILINQASSALDEKFSAVLDGLKIDNVNILNFLVERGLTSIVTKPKYYLGGIEAIDLPFVVRQPEIFLDPNVTDFQSMNNKLGTEGQRAADLAKLAKDLGGKYDGWDGKDGPILLDRESSADYWVRGDRYERWANARGTNYTTVEGIHWPDGLENFLPAKLGEYSDTYSYIAREENPTLFDGNFAYKYYKYVDIFPSTHAYYHLNPNTANIDGQTLQFYCNYPYMTLVTRYQVEDGKTQLLYSDEAWTNPSFTLSNDMVKNGILDVKFYLDVQAYLNTWGKNFIDAFDAKNGYGSAKVTLNEQGYGSDDVDPDYIGYGINYNAYNDCSFAVNSYDLGVNEASVRMPFVAAQITGENRTVTSDYAAVLPSFIQLLALADSMPDTKIAKAWSEMDHNMVEQNHLYRTPEEAIAGAATHQLVYNDKKGINLDEFIQTHAYRFGTRYCRDYALTPEEMEEYGLHYEYTLVDYESDLYNDEQSKHASLIGRDLSVYHTGNTIVARVVNPETGETTGDQDISSVGREPIVRVMLVHNSSYKGEAGQEHILLKGYVKFRIVEKIQEDLYARIPLGANDAPVFMGCYETDSYTLSGLAWAQWHQFERYIEDATGVKLSKAKFDQTYMLETNPNYLGAKRYIEYPEGSHNFYDEATWVKNLEKTYKTTGMTLEQAVQANLGFAQEYFKAFAGHVGYTGFEGTEDDSSAPSGITLHDPLGVELGNDILAKQQNVLYWALGSYNDATAHTYINGAVSDPQTDEKYIEYIAKVNPYTGVSTDSIYTWVKFIPRNLSSADPIYVKLVIPAGKLQWAAGDMRGQKLAYWYEYQSEKNLSSDVRDKKNFDAEGDHVFEVHVNAPIQALDQGYDNLKETDYIQDMSFFFQDGVKFTNLVKYAQKADAASKNPYTGAIYATYPGFTGDVTGIQETTNLSQDKVSFYFTLPSKTLKHNADFDADFVTDGQWFNCRSMADTFRYENNGKTHAIKVWQARGYSGKKYTLALANKNSKGKLQTWEYKTTVDNQEVRAYMEAIYEQIKSGSAAKLYTDGHHSSVAEDIKSLYNKVQSVERGTYIVAIREVGYDIPNDWSFFTGKDADDVMGYNPALEIIYDEPIVICQLENNKADWGTAKAQGLIETAASKSGIVPRNNYFRYNQNAIAEDILNAQSDCNNFKGSDFGPFENLKWGYKQGAFTAYIETVYNDIAVCTKCNVGCYEIFDPQRSRFFNLRVDRPVYFTAGTKKLEQDALNKEVSTEVTFGWTDWRPYTLTKKTNDDSKSQIVASYYDVMLDNAYYGSGKTAEDKITFTSALLDEIRTDCYTDAKETDYGTFFEAGDVEWEYRIPVDVTTLQGRIYVNTLPVASRWAKYADLSGQGVKNSQLDIWTGGEKLFYRNTDAHMRAFNLYVPVYWSYVFGNGELPSGILEYKVNELVAANLYGADYADADASGIVKSTPAAPKYVYFKDRRFNKATKVNFNNQDWYVIQVIKTKDKH